jgi:predicted nucleic acid-binding protein
MDEHVGRNVARTLGLSVRGSLGILIAAYRCNLLNAEQLRLDLMEIARRPDIWINPDLVRRLLHDVLDEFSP